MRKKDQREERRFNQPIDSACFQIAEANTYIHEHFKTIEERKEEKKFFKDVDDRE